MKPLFLAESSHHAPGGSRSSDCSSAVQLAQHLLESTLAEVSGLSIVEPGDALPRRAPFSRRQARAVVARWVLSAAAGGAAPRSRRGSRKSHTSGR